MSEEIHIRTEDPSFTPEKFVICNFYNEETCFCWNNNILVMFPYLKQKLVPPAKIVTAPSTIKKINCFSGRIFLTCLPQGIYKLSRNHEFGILSKSAIGLGTEFYEVLVPKNDYLHLDDKRNISSKSLLHLSSGQEIELHTISLNLENAHKEFVNALSDKENTDLCVISNGKNLFTLINDTLKIIYNSDVPIANIVPVQRGDKIAGLLLLTTTDAVITLTVTETDLVFDKIYLRTQIHAICAGMSESLQDTLWIVYCNKQYLYFMSKRKDMTQQIKSEERNFLCLQYWKSKIVGLTQDKRLVEISLDSIENLVPPKEEYFMKLACDMLQDSESIVNEICKKAKELEPLNKKLLSEQDKLRRINLYTYQKKLKVTVRMQLQKIADRLYFQMDLQDGLHKNTHLILSLKSDQQRIFCIKSITDTETNIGMDITDVRPSNSIQIDIDLAAVITEGEPWCLIKNFVNETSLLRNRRGRSRKDKSSFIDTKLAILKNLVKTGELDMRKLSEIKRSIRKEVHFPDTVS